MKEHLLKLFHRGADPYAGFPVEQWRGTWFDDPGAQREIFGRCLYRCDKFFPPPLLIVEVGSFVGESAIFMAKQMKEKKMWGSILCVDTWLGGIDHWLKAPEKIHAHFGRTDLYYRFVANVIEHGCADMIVPLALDSQNGARLLTELGLRPHMVYVDASHEKGDVGRDLEAYWELLRPGGVLLVDDVFATFPGVVDDWEDFAHAHDLPRSTWDQQGEKIAVIRP